MSKCYPTGCPPCVDDLNFPENPEDGQKECVTIDAQGTQKCWVYDKCIPGWRAAGTSPSPVRYKGGIDLTRGARNQYPDLAAGDFFVVTNAANANTPSLYPGLDSTVNVGERVVYSGSDWQVVSPDLPYADEALGDVPLGDDGKPVDDNRMGGIVKNATLSQAKAGTDKCDTITPYTLKGVVGDIIDFTPTKPSDSGVTVIIDQGDSLAQCINNTTLTLSATAKALTEDGDTAIGRWKYQWSEDGADLRLVKMEAVSGGSTDTLTITDFTIDPVTDTRTFKVVATFTDLFGTEYTAEDTIPVTLANAAEITSQPVELDLTTNTTGTMSVSVEPVNADLAAPTFTYKWFVNNVEITGATTPDIGYTFTNFTAATLDVTRTAGDAGTYSVRAEVEGGCQVMLNTDSVFLKGPGGEDSATIIQPPPGTDLGSVGSYTVYNSGYPGLLSSNGLVNKSIDFRFTLNGTWRIMGNWLNYNGGSTVYNSPTFDRLYLLVRVS